MNTKTRISLVVAFALVVVVVVALCWQPALAQRDAASGFPRYSVIDSEGHNLIVTDNQSNTVYFYTIDKDAKIGSELKLRGTLDLTQVGKPTLRLKQAK
jgi:hypothetical protein